MPVCSRAPERTRNRPYFVPGSSALHKGALVTVFTGPKFVGPMNWVARQTPPLLPVQGLSESYRLGCSRLPVLSGLSLNLSAGEMVVIMGTSGSGKTMLLNCIAGIDMTDCGGVELSGEALDCANERAHAQRRRRTGMAFQSLNLNLTPSLTERRAAVLRGGDTRSRARAARGAPAGGGRNGAAGRGRTGRAARGACADSRPTAGVRDLTRVRAFDLTSLRIPRTPRKRTRP